MKKKELTIQIGPLSNDPSESVSAICRTLINGLQDDHIFFPVLEARRFGATRQSAFNVLNCYYFAKHVSSWVLQLAVNRPAITHYAVSTGWAMEKGVAYLALARAFGAKTIGHLHSGEFIKHWKIIPEWRRSLARRELRKLDAMIVLSESWRDIVVESVGLPPAKVFVVNNPIDAEFENAALQMPIERREANILSLGVMAKDKGVMDALEATRRVGTRAEFQLLLAGPEREPNIRLSVQQFIAQHDLTNLVQLKSSVWGPEKLQCFGNTSIFLLPSYYENFPLVLLEAAAAGHAIITTSVGAIPEFFEDGITAVFVEPGNAEQIAQAIINLVGNQEQRERLGRAAREMFLQRLSRRGIYESLKTVYRAVNASPPRAARRTTRLAPACGGEGQTD